MIFERKTIRNVPKPNVLVKIRNFIPKLPVSLACKSSTGSQGQGKTRGDLATKLFLYSVNISHVVMWSGHVFNMKT
jgi:hypothetical protein